MLTSLCAQAAAVLLTCALLLRNPAQGAEKDTVVREVGENVTLPCRNVSLSNRTVDWLRNGNKQPVLSSSLPPWDLRFSFGKQNSLQITELQLDDEGNYTCSLAQDALGLGNIEPQTQLLLASAPSNTIVSISPSWSLPNGTFYVPHGSIVQFVCTTDSYPVPNMTWVFSQPTKAPENFSDENGTALNMTLFNISPRYQGNYSCLVNNSRSLKIQEVTVTLLVYDLPKSSPSCWAETSETGSTVNLVCSWRGGYPEPVFQWRHKGDVLGHSESTIAGLGTTDQFVVTLNKTELVSGEQFECRGSHILQKEAWTCTIYITSPTLEPQPLNVCFPSENVTLVCLATATSPPANFTWWKNLQKPQVEIQPSEKYQITQTATSSLLTIHNCSPEADTAYYVCRAENPLGVKELDVWLTVHSQSNIVGLVAALVILFIFAIGGITVLVLYCKPEFCSTAHLRVRGTGDVMMLIESDGEEDIVEETPPTEDTPETVQAANGNIKHAVICHRVPETFT